MFNFLLNQVKKNYKLYNKAGIFNISLDLVSQRLFILSSNIQFNNILIKKKKKISQLFRFYYDYYINVF